MIIHELSIKYIYIYIYNHQPDFVNHYHGKCYVIYHIYPHMISVISSILIIIIAYLVGDVRDSSRVSYLSAGGRSAAGKPMRAATARRDGDGRVHTPGADGSHGELRLVVEVLRIFLI